MARISIVTSGHISTNPRVWREADALSDGGHEVTVIGVSFDPKQAEIDKQMLNKRQWTYEAAADLRRRSVWHRSRARIGRTLLAMNIHDPHSIGYAANRVLVRAIKQKADLTITHLEPAMWVGTELHKRGFRVGVDIEDWYSEASPETNGPRQRFLHKLEEEILALSVHATTTSDVMADALVAQYRCRKPKVIYNSLPSNMTCNSSVPPGPIWMIWFSQTLGKDRGLQDVFGALPLLHGHWRLELRAKASAETRAWVDSQVPLELRSRVSIEPTVSPEQLSSVVANCDIGLAPEPPSSGNKALTIANKMFQYLQCGLTVAATDTPGQREVLTAFPEGGRLYCPGDSHSLAALLNALLSDPAKLRSCKTSIALRANQQFAYERQTGTLLESVHRGLES